MATDATEEQDFRGVAVERKAVNEVGRGDGCVVPPPKRRRKEGGVVVGVVWSRPRRVCAKNVLRTYASFPFVGKIE